MDEPSIRCMVATFKYMAHLPLSQQSHKEVKIVSRLPIASEQASALTLRPSLPLCLTASVPWPLRRGPWHSPAIYL